MEQIFQITHMLEVALSLRDVKKSCKEFVPVLDYDTV